MARYIDADALIEELKSLSITVTGLINGKGYLSQIVKEYKDSILRIIDEQPTADVVPKSELDKKQQEMLHHLKRDLHEKAAYSRNKGIDSYIPLKVVDAIINNYLRDLEEKKHSE